MSSTGYSRGDLQGLSTSDGVILFLKSELLISQIIENETKVFRKESFQIRTQTDILEHQH